ncbi:hypothetical protein SO802_018834 [Lithocarpus litseifolius]|uniref:Uncharacterized protein n=1 Tax=Lithocarpus litseifolius TaxID=425828 RepID=A0AAW2CME8_9ROSI
MTATTEEKAAATTAKEEAMAAIDEGNRGPAMEVRLCGGHVSFGHDHGEETRPTTVTASKRVRGASTSASSESFSTVTSSATFTSSEVHTNAEETRLTTATASKRVRGASTSTKVEAKVDISAQAIQIPHY